MRNAADVTIQVRCSGALHRIVLTRRGALVPVDCGREAWILARLSQKAEVDSPTRCSEVCRAWAHGLEYSLVPVGLRPLRQQSSDAGDSRRKKRGCFDPLKAPLYDRISERTYRLARTLLEKANYRRAAGKWAGGAHIVNVAVRGWTRGCEGISGSSSTVWSPNGKWSGKNSTISATIHPLSWYRAFLLGLALVDGLFVLRICEQQGNDAVVLVGVQGRGFEVRMERRRVRRQEDGSWTFSKGRATSTGEEAAHAHA